MVELLVMMTTDHSWLNGVIMNNNWPLWCKGPVLCVLLMTLSTTCREEIWYTRTWTNIYLFPSTQNLHCRLVIVIIGTHNTDVLSTTAGNDLVMILYYDTCYAHRSSRSEEGFYQKCSYRYGGTCCSHSEWTRLLGISLLLLE